MKEKVIIQELSISKKAEVNAFEFKVPSDAKSIIGIEGTSNGLILPDIPVFGSLPSGLYDFQRSAVVGEIRMQSCGKTNLFYSGEVCFNDLNIGFGDFTQSGEWTTTGWIKGLKREEDAVFMNDCCSIIHGNYTDTIGRISNVDLVYTIKLYLWYTIE